MGGIWTRKIKSNADCVPRIWNLEEKDDKTLWWDSLSACLGLLVSVVGTFCFRFSISRPSLVYYLLCLDSYRLGLLHPSVAKRLDWVCLVRICEWEDEWIGTDVTGARVPCWWLHGGKLLITATTFWNWCSAWSGRRVKLHNMTQYHYHCKELGIRQPIGYILLLWSLRHATELGRVTALITDSTHSVMHGFIILISKNEIEGSTVP